MNYQGVKMLEQWTSLNFMECSKYKASSSGKICNVRTGYIKSPSIHSGGYLCVGLTQDNGRERTFLVHTIIAAAFIGVNTNPKLTVDHINRIRTDNNAHNLRYATAEEQAANSAPRTRILGKQIAQYDLNNNQIKVWDKIIDAANAVGISASGISAVCNGRQKTSGGFIWKYYKEYYDDEIWLLVPHPEFEVLYASTYGRICKIDGTITEGFECNGYLKTGVYGYLGLNSIELDTNKHYVVFVHRLVAAAFLGRNDNLEVNHKDGNPKNNHINNLEFVTRQENMIHAYTIGARKSRKVRQYDMNGIYIAEFVSITAAAATTPANKTRICDVCNGRAISSGGYIWRYAD